MNLANFSKDLFIETSFEYPFPNQQFPISPVENPFSSFQNDLWNASDIEDSPFSQISPRWTPAAPFNNYRNSSFGSPEWAPLEIPPGNYQNPEFQNPEWTGSFVFENTIFDGDEMEDVQPVCSGGFTFLDESPFSQISPRWTPAAHFQECDPVESSHDDHTVARILTEMNQIHRFEI